MNGTDEFFLRIPLGDWADWLIDWLKDNLEGLFDAFSWLILLLVDNLTTGLLLLPPLAMVLIFAAIGWLVRSWGFGIGSALLFLFALTLDVWEPMMQTMAQVLIAAAIAVLIAVPLGILAAMNSTVSALIRPVLDFMQTMPAFVYLIPTVVLFGIGVVPGMVSTIVFSLPPGVRMTELGIRQVDSETVEAGESFGATPGQILRGIQLPLAVPTIMAGINQVIMLALSMVVIGGIAGAPGLGKEVVQAINTLTVPDGIEAGVGVVLLAVYLDRLTAAFGNRSSHTSSLLALVRRAGSRRRHAQASAA